MIAQHFKLQELVDRATFEKYRDDCWNLFPDESIQMIDGIWVFFNSMQEDGKPVSVTINNWFWGGSFQYRGYRPPECTIGAAGSYHRTGRAFDMDIGRITAGTARGLILQYQDDPLLEKIQRMEVDVSWLHCDIGQIPSGKSRIYVFRG